MVEDVKTAQNCTGLPVIIGSGITEKNIENYWNLADAFIVGSWFKHEENWKNPVSEERVKAFIQKVRELRNNS